MRTITRCWPLLLLAACSNDSHRESLATRRPDRVSRVATTPDTAVFSARQAGHPVDVVSAVMHLTVTAPSSVIVVENESGQQAMTGTPGTTTREEMVGSSAESTPTLVDLPTAGWRAAVSVPVLEGEHYLLELAPSTPRRETATLDLTADGVRLGGTKVEMDATGNESTLFDIVIGPRSIVASPPIARIDIVPTCGTTHVLRSAGRADLYAQYEVIETHEQGELRIPPRADDAQFRSVTFKTKTRGGVRVIYLGRELATAPRPDACPE